jgi:hypothetical protein
MPRRELAYTMTWLYTSYVPTTWRGSFGALLGEGGRGILIACTVTWRHRNIHAHFSLLEERSSTKLYNIIPSAFGPKRFNSNCYVLYDLTIPTWCELTIHRPYLLHLMRTNQLMRHTRQVRKKGYTEDWMATRWKTHTARGTQSAGQITAIDKFKAWEGTSSVYSLEFQTLRSRSRRAVWVWVYSLVLRLVPDMLVSRISLYPGV